MKLFGKEILAKKDELDNGELYDFARHGLLREYTHIGVADIDLMAISGDDEISREYTARVAKNNAIANAGKSKTPKEVYVLEGLNDTDFKLNCDPAYIQKQVRSLNRKANLMPKGTTKKRNWGEEILSGGTINGREEVVSMIERMQNRLRYTEVYRRVSDGVQAGDQTFKDFYEQYAWTTSAKINDLLKEVTNLRSKRIEEFIPDLPDEALDVIEEYDAATLALCNKKPVYYMIADKKDFGEMDRKRDPILLVQSPFNLGWQVLGAWDEEMVYLGDL